MTTDLAAIDALLARVPEWRCDSQRAAAPGLREAVVTLRARVAELEAERDAHRKVGARDRDGGDVNFTTEKE